MKILLTNDDGYTSEGIKVLEEKLKKYGEVFVIAPYEYMSGKAISLTIFDPMKLHKFDSHHFALEGTPADCVSFALSEFKEKFDVVVSGINDGLNISYDILHSGTIGACIESLMYGVPSLAFSHYHNLDFVIDYFDEAMNFVLENNLLSKDHVVNVNFPKINEYHGIKLAKVELRKDRRYFDIKGDIVIPQRVEDDPLKYDKNGEIYLTATGYTAVSLLNKDFYDPNRYLEYLEKISK